VDNFFEVLAAGRKTSRGGFGQPRMGTVTSSNAQIAMAKVLLQPEGVLTGWLPVLTQWVGSGWGMSCPPSPGDQVLVIPQEGDAQHGLIVGRVYSNLVRPPPAEPGEINLTHQSGCSIRLLNSGTIAIHGDLHVSGDVYDSYGPLSKLRNDYNIHIHHTSSGLVTSGPLPLD
jgi:type VI secretion system (T6SS) baseplate-like injector VgrG